MKTSEIGFILSSFSFPGHKNNICFNYITQDGTATTKSESIQTTIDAEQRVAKGRNHNNLKRV